MSKLEMQEFANVWDAIADTPEEAANLTVRSDLMDEIEAIIKTNGCMRMAKHTVDEARLVAL